MGKGHPRKSQKINQFLFIFRIAYSGYFRRNFLDSNEIEVFTYGAPPVSINLMKVVKGCNFEEAYSVSKIYDEEGLLIRFININTLIQAKKASGRFKDLDDIEKLSTQ